MRGKKNKQKNLDLGVSPCRAWLVSVSGWWLWSHSAQLDAGLNWSSGSVCCEIIGKLLVLSNPL